MRSLIVLIVFFCICNIGRAESSLAIGEISTAPKKRTQRAFVPPAIAHIRKKKLSKKEILREEAALKMERRRKNRINNKKKRRR